MNESRPIRPASVTVTVPARLHLGFLDLNGGIGRRFGSLGLALDTMSTSVRIAPAPRTEVTGEDAARAARHLQAMRQALGLADGFRLMVERSFPSHIGLGSGTQLALAVAAAVRRLCGRSLDVGGDAVRLGRGGRSGVGIGLFDRGGFVVDGGRGSATGAAPVVSRMDVPEDWRVLVVLDPRRQGVHGADELQAFARLAPMTEELAGRLCRLVLMQVLPALAERDLASFGDGVTELQRGLGEYFAPVQGGLRFISPDVAAVLALMSREGAVGIGQSSWGPTGFAIANAAQADALVAAARRHHAGSTLDIRVCRALNRGASIAVEAETS